MDTPIIPRAWRVVHPILASGVPLEPGAAVILSPAPAYSLEEAGYLEPLAELPPEGAIALEMLDETREPDTAGGQAAVTGRDDDSHHAGGATSPGTDTASALKADPATPAGDTPAGPEAPTDSAKPARRSTTRSKS